MTDDQQARALRLADALDSPESNDVWIASTEAANLLRELAAEPSPWPEGLRDRIESAIERINNGHAPRRIPADPTDVDLVLAEVRNLVDGKDPPFWLKRAVAAEPKCNPTLTECPRCGNRSDHQDDQCVLRGGSVMGTPFAVENPSLHFQKAEPVRVPMTWQPIETAPKGRIVLVYYTNDCGRGRTMRARYYLPETLESEVNESGWCDEGWYEESEAYEYLMPLEHDPTHWMPLPDAPHGITGDAK